MREDLISHKYVLDRVSPLLEEVFDLDEMLFGGTEIFYEPATADDPDLGYYQPPPSNPERLLWLNVLRGAIEDALADDPVMPDNATGSQRWAYGESMHKVGETRAYFIDSVPDFETVCDLAGVESVLVRHAVVERL